MLNHNYLDSINSFVINTNTYIKNKNCDDLVNKAISEDNQQFLIFILKNDGIINNIDFEGLLRNKINFDFFVLLIKSGLNFGHRDKDNKNILYWLCKLNYGEVFINEAILNKSEHLSTNEKAEMNNNIKKIYATCIYNKGFDCDMLPLPKVKICPCIPKCQQIQQNLYKFFNIHLEYNYKNNIDDILKNINNGNVLLFLVINYIEIEEMIVKFIEFSLNINNLLNIYCGNLDRIRVKNKINIVKINLLDNFCKITILLIKMKQHHLLNIDPSLLDNNLLLRILNYYKFITNKSIIVSDLESSIIKSVYSINNLLLLFNFLKIKPYNNIYIYISSYVTVSFKDFLNYFHNTYKKINTKNIRSIIYNIHPDNLISLVEFIIEKKIKINKLFIKDILYVCINLEIDEDRVLKALTLIINNDSNIFSYFEILLCSYRINDIDKFNNILNLLIINGLDIDSSIGYLIRFPFINKDVKYKNLLNIIEFIIDKGYEINKTFSSNISNNNKWELRENKNILYWALKKYDFKKLSTKYTLSLINMLFNKDIVPLEREDIYDIHNDKIKQRLIEYLYFCEKNMYITMVHNYMHFDIILINKYVKKAKNIYNINCNFKNILNFLSYIDLKNFNFALFH
jgi:hypothetical protein